MSIREDIDEWVQFLNNPKWKLICQWAEEQMTSRTVAVMQGTRDPREEDRLRGEYGGIGLFVQYPHVVLDILQTELDKEKEGE